MNDAELFRRRLAAQILGVLGAAALTTPTPGCGGVDAIAGGGAAGGAGGATSVASAGTGAKPTVKECFTWTPDQGACPVGEAGVLNVFKCCGCPTGFEPLHVDSGPTHEANNQCCYQVELEVCAEGGRPYLVDARARVATVERGTRRWGRSRALARAATSAAPRAASRDHGPMLDGLSPTERAALAAAWTADALLEHASVASFSRFSLALLAAGAPADLLTLAHRAALDEIRHAALCFALASAYAGEDVAPGPFPLGDVVHVGATLEEIAVSAVHEGCIGETVAAAVAAQQLALATDPAVRAALAQIAEDEGRHAQLAWATVAWATRAGGAGVRAAIARALFDALAGSRGARRTEALAAPAGLPACPRPEALEAHGRLDDPTVARITAMAMAEIVAPAAAALCCGEGKAPRAYS